MKKSLYLLFFLSCTFLPIFAQEYDFNILSVEDGLSQSSVTCITQDDKGFVWIGTRDGLNSYDGYDVEVFRKIPFDSTSLKSNFIISLLADSEGLWVGTNGGLQWYNWNTKRFENIKLLEGDSPIYIRKIYRDNFGNIWASTSYGVFSVKKEKDENKFIVKKYFGDDKNEARDKFAFRVFNFLHDSQNRFWLASNKGLFQLYFDSNQNLKIENDLDSIPKKYLKDPRIHKELLEHSDGNIYATIGNKINCYTNENDKFSNFFEIKPDKNKKAIVTQLSEFPDGQLVATTEVGFQFINTQNGEITNSKYLSLPSKGVSDNRDKINFIHCDNVYKDLYWLATDIGGVVKMHRKQKHFKTQYLKDIPSLQINNPYLRHIAGDEKHIWYNLGRMLLIENRDNHTFQLFENIFPSGSIPGNMSISFIFQTQDEKILIGLGNEILELWIDNNGTQRSKSLGSYPTCIFKSNSIIETPQHYILGGINGNISIIEKEGTKQVTCLDLNESFEFTNKNKISSLLLDSQSNLWVGTSNGLFLYPEIDLGVKTTSKPIYFYYNPTDTTSLIENMITHLMEDSKQNVWVCTRNGLMTTKITNEKIQLKRVKSESLQQQVIYGILEDKQSGYLWMSTNSGLFTYDHVTKKVNNFNVKDGLQGNEFNTYSFFKSHTGEMFFGGPKGLTNFHPSDIELNEQSPPIWFTEFKTIDDKKVDLITFDKKKTLFLDYKQRTFSIRFIGLDFLQPEEVQYFYKLIGETEIQEASLGNSRQINFSQLRPGNYSLQIKAVNKDGAFSKKGETLHFTIRAPFWKMMWFYLLITALIIGLFWLVFYLRYRNKMNQLDAIEKVRKSIAEDFHDEMGSKLSIISMYSEFTKNELEGHGGKAALYIDKVNATAARLYDNTRDLIWVLNPQNDTLYDLFLQLSDFGEELFKDSGINFHSSGIPDHLKNENLPVRYKRHLLLIFKEGMHNSLKHSSCKNVTLSINQQKQGLTFILQDDGIGFDTNIIYKGDGLKNMRYRASQINSELHFVSKKEGTRLRLDTKY